MLACLLAISLLHRGDPIRGYPFKILHSTTNTVCPSAVTHRPNSMRENGHRRGADDCYDWHNPKPEWLPPDIRLAGENTARSNATHLNRQLLRLRFDALRRPRWSCRRRIRRAKPTRSRQAGSTTRLLRFRPHWTGVGKQATPEDVTRGAKSVHQYQQPLPGQNTTHLREGGNPRARFDVVVVR